MATCPGGPMAAATASAASWATDAGSVELRIQVDTPDGDRCDVALQRRVVLGVVGGVVADDVDDGRAAAAGVVQVGQAVAEAGAQVQQHRCGPAGHAGVAVGGAGGDALEQREHRVHLGHAVERRDEVHLGGAGVHEAGVDAGVDQGADQRLRAVHGLGHRGEVSAGSGRRRRGRRD